MTSIPKKVAERFIKEVGKFQTILKNAKNRDVNEADTVTIVNDILCYVFGFDKYSEITSEFAIRNTYCDLAIKLDAEVKYLVEVKAIGIPLKETHTRQALEYGANQGVQWIVLTNGIDWEIYRITFEKPLQVKRIFTMNFLDIIPRKSDDQEKLYLLCKEGLTKSAIDHHYEHRKIVNRFNIAALLLSDATMNVIKREMKKLSPLKVENTEIEKILRNDVLKREVIDGDEAKQALTTIKKAERRAARRSTHKPAIKTDIVEKPTESLLKESTSTPDESIDL